MLNQTVLVGRLVADPEVKKLKDGKKVSNMTIAVPRSYKNENGEYNTDFIDCVMWNNVAENTKEYCHKGDIIGVKGRIQTDTYETENGEKRKTTEIVAEKVTFLSSKPLDKDDEEKDEDQDLEV